MNDGIDRYNRIDIDIDIDNDMVYLYPMRNIQSLREPD